LIEEWVALGQRLLQTYTAIPAFRDVVQRGNYHGPTLDIERPEHFPNDKDFVEFVEGKAVGIYVPYLDKEEEAKITSLGSQRCINRVFDLMGVEYDDRPILAEQKDEAAERAKGMRPAPAKEKRPAKAKGHATRLRDGEAFEEKPEIYSRWLGPR